MSQSGITSYIVTFNYSPTDPADIARLHDLLLQEGFGATIADANGIPHTLAPNSYAITSVQSAAEIARQAHTLAQTALGSSPTIEIVQRDDYFSRLYEHR